MKHSELRLHSAPMGKLRLMKMLLLMLETVQAQGSLRGCDFHWDSRGWDEGREAALWGSETDRQWSSRCQPGV